MDDEQHHDPIELLKTALEDLRYATARIQEWPCPPDPSIVAAWSPLLSEKMHRIENALVQCQRQLQPPRPPYGEPPGSKIEPGMKLSEVEKIHIMRTLIMAGGNRERTATMLDIGARTLYRKLNEYGLH